jgi:hypothetical protein
MFEVCRSSPCTIVHCDGPESVPLSTMVKALMSPAANASANSFRASSVGRYTRTESKRTSSFDQA